MALEINVLEDGRISVPYSRTRGTNTFTDAIVLSQEDYDALTEEQITAMMDARFDKWYNYINPPQVAPETE